MRQPGASATLPEGSPPHAPWRGRASRVLRPGWPARLAQACEQPAGQLPECRTSWTAPTCPACGRACCQRPRRRGRRHHHRRRRRLLLLHCSGGCWWHCPQLRAAAGACAAAGPTCRCAAAAAAAWGPSCQPGGGWATPRAAGTAAGAAMVVVVGMLHAPLPSRTALQLSTAGALTAGAGASSRTFGVAAAAVPLHSLRPGGWLGRCPVNVCAASESPHQGCRGASAAAPLLATSISRLSVAAGGGGSRGRGTAVIVWLLLCNATVVTLSRL